MASMEHRNRIVSRSDCRTLLRDSEKRAARAIISLHYSFLCLSIGFILGAWNYYDRLAQVRSTVVVTTGGLLIAGYLGARSEERDQHKVREAQKAQETEEAKASYHIHYGPLGIIEHANDHDPDYDHDYGTFLYDYERYEL